MGEAGTIGFDIARSVAEAAPDGGKDTLGSIAKQGNRYLRRLLVAGAMAVAAVALANKIARERRRQLARRRLPQN